MAVPDPLSRKLRDKLGAEAGADLMTWLEEMRAENRGAAVRHDAAMARIDARFDKLESRFDKLESRFDKLEARFDAFEERVDQRFTEVDRRFTAVEVRIAETKADLLKWSFVFWCGAVAAIAGLAGVLRP